MCAELHSASRRPCTDGIARRPRPRHIVNSFTTSTAADAYVRASANISEQTDRRLMSFVARGKGGTEEGKIGPRIRITESFVIANRKPYRRRGYGRAGEINGGLCAKSASATPPGRHVDAAPVGHDTRARSPRVHLAIDRSPFSFPRIKTHGLTSAVRVAHITRQLVTSLLLARARASAVVEREISDVRYLDSSLRAILSSRRADTQIAILRFTCTRPLFISRHLRKVEDAWKNALSWLY